MDFFAHGFWSYIFFYKTKKPLLAVLFGLLPDITSWMIFMFYMIFTEGHIGQPIVENIPRWTLMLYGISHSLFVFMVVTGMVYIFLHRVPVYMFAWALHILVDIPTHSRDFLPTPFLWPVSDWAFPGIGWGTSWFMIMNYSLIVFFILTIYMTKKSKTLS
jgi:hypothetical protein